MKQSAIYYLDPNFLFGTKAPIRTIVRRLPMRTLLFLTIQLERLDYRERKHWICVIFERLPQLENKVSENAGKPFNFAIFGPAFNGEEAKQFWRLPHRQIMGISNCRTVVQSASAGNPNVAFKWETFKNKNPYIFADTLGGAVSAMGFFDEQFIAQAMRISLKQLQVATMLGDPVLVARCHLYIALSLAQSGHIRLAMGIVRHVWDQANQLGSTFLANCVQGIWATLRWMVKKRKKAIPLQNAHDSH